MRQRSDYDVFSDTELERRHRVTNGMIDRNGVDALLIYGSGPYASNTYWLSDWPVTTEPGSTDW